MKENTDAIYKIPSPMEMFLFLEQNSCPYVKEALHDPNQIGEYTTTMGKAINFGIYSADLAYSSVYGDNQNTLTYFNTARKLASELGLYEGYGEEIAERIDQNLNSIDSLIDISAESYDVMTLTLEDQGLSDVLGFILAGGWTESLYLTFESMDHLDMNSPIIERIVDQQILLDNLLAYLKHNNNTVNNQNLVSKLEEVQEIFDNLYFNNENVPITKKQFVDLSNKVNELRKNVVGQL